MAREGAADYLTQRLTDELAQALGKPLRDGWSVQYHPEDRSWFVGWRNSF